MLEKKPEELDTLETRYEKMQDAMERKLDLLVSRMVLASDNRSSLCF